MPNGDETTTVNLKDGTVLHLKGKLSSEQVQQKVSEFRQANPPRQSNLTPATISAQTSAGSRILSAAKRGGPTEFGKELGSITAEKIKGIQTKVPGTGKTVGEAFGDTQKYADLLSTTLGITGGAGFGAGAVVGEVSEGAASLASKIPRVGHAAEAFEKVKGLAKNVDIATNGPAEIADKAMSFREGGTPQVMRDFVNRVTRPGATRLTYEEARGYYSDATKLLKDPNLDNSMRPFVTQFVDSLGNEIRAGVKSLGPEAAEKYEGAMKEYHRAKGVEEGLDKLKNLAIKKVIPYATYLAIARLILGNVGKHIISELSP